MPRRPPLISSPEITDSVPFPFPQLLAAQTAAHTNHDVSRNGPHNRNSNQNDQNQKCEQTRSTERQIVNPDRFPKVWLLPPLIYVSSDLEREPKLGTCFLTSLVNEHSLIANLDVDWGTRSHWCLLSPVGLKYDRGQVCFGSSLVEPELPATCKIGPNLNHRCVPKLVFCS